MQLKVSESLSVRTIVLVLLYVLLCWQSKVWKNEKNGSTHPTRYTERCHNTVKIRGFIQSNRTYYKLEITERCVHNPIMFIFYQIIMLFDRTDQALAWCGLDDHLFDSHCISKVKNFRYSRYHVKQYFISDGRYYLDVLFWLERWHLAVFTSINDSEGN